MILHNCISGFGQGLGGQGHGMFWASEKLLDRHPHPDRERVYLWRWNEDWRSIAEHLKLVADLHERSPQIAIHAYSWGAGYGAMELARELARLELDVRVMVLSDPVLRTWMLSLRWLALCDRDIPIFGSPVIRVPCCVREVHCFHQRMNRPRGHRLLATNGTTIHPSTELHCVHARMDEAAAFHAKILEVADQLCEEAAAA